MASVGYTDNQQELLLDIERLKNIKLRDAGLEYVSKSGRHVPAKKQPGQLCNCPQRCTDKIPQETREKLFIEFYKLADQVLQNRFLQKFIQMRSVQKRLWSEEHRIDGRLQRRVSCKYHIPIGAHADIADDERHSVESENEEALQTKEQKLQATKLKKRPRRFNNTVEVCQKAFMNMYTITEKRVRLLREKLIMKSRQNVKNHTAPHIDEIETAFSLAKNLLNSLEPPLLQSQLPNLSEEKILSSIDRDITLVNNFFFYQLWKPEEIGEAKDNKLNNASIKSSTDDENDDNNNNEEMTPTLITAAIASGQPTEISKKSAPPCIKLI